MPILADRVDVIIGVDTHTDTHTAAVLTSVGAVLAQLTVPTSAEGHAMLLAWASQRTQNRDRAWVIDGARSHGIGLARHLHTVGEQVIEAPRIPGQAHRREGKSDPLDAIHTARTALAAEHVATPRGDGTREDLRILYICHRHYTDTRTATVNLFKSLILTADDGLRTQLRNLSTTLQQVRHAAQLDPADIRHQQLTSLAADILALDHKINDNKAALHKLVNTICPTLLDQYGVGPINAAIALIAWSHPGRLRNEAAFAALAGTNPIPASSGRITRHRLNRGGDRILNAALHTIVLTRRRHHQPTRDYLTRRTSEGKTSKEINRCLKRYIARQLFKIMEQAARPTP